MYGLIKVLMEKNVGFRMMPTVDFITGTDCVTVRLEKDGYCRCELVNIDIIEMNAVMTVEQFLINMVERFVKEVENK